MTPSNSRSLATVLLLIISSAGGAWASDLEVQILGADAEGVVFVTLFDGAEGYEEERDIGSRKIPATGETIRISFKGLTPGHYGLKSFQDRNSNDKIDTGFLGIPKEPYGFSNDARGRMGPPDFDQVKFLVTGEKTSIQFQLE